MCIKARLTLVTVTCFQICTYNLTMHDKKTGIHTQAMLPGTSMLEFTSIDTPVPFSRAAKMTLLATSDHIMYPSL